VKAILSIFGGLAAAMAAFIFPSDGPTPTSVCELARQPQSFDHRTVQVVGYMESDGLEWLQLKDDKCPREAVNIDYSPNFSGSPQAQKISNTIFHTPPLGTAYKDIRGTFIGDYTWKAGTPPDSKVVIHEVRDLNISPLKKKRASPFPELN
jgi:hypothetical protein